MTMAAPRAGDDDAPMMQSFGSTLPRLAQPSLSPRTTRIAAVAGRSALAVAFVVAGMIFLALTFAATIAVPIAGRQGLALSGLEIATADRLGSIWWLFAAGVVVTFGAALATLGRVMQGLGDPSDR
jgi:hypothetical protein